MNNDLVKSAIKRYLLNDNKYNNLALQINGAWGTGKTFYIKNTIMKGMIHNGGSNKYIPVYISLNGISTISQLKNKLIQGLLTFGVHGHKRVAYTTLNILSNGLGTLFDYDEKLSIVKKIGINPDSIKKVISNTILSNKSNIVLIFDDLERCKLSLKVIFGILSNILDDFKCKMIIISSESEFNPHDRKFYNKNKEKLIGKTVHFGNHSESIAFNILNSSIESNKYLPKKWILNSSKQMMARLKDINLRTIFSIISTYNELFNELNNLVKRNHINHNVLTQSLKTGYLSIFTLTDLIKRDKLNFSLLNSLFEKRFQGITYYIKSESRSYLYKTFLNKCDVSFSNNIFYTKDIYSLITSDIFNSKSYINKIKKSFYSKNAIVDISYDKLYYEYLFLPDKKIRQYELNIYNNLDISKFSFVKLINLYSLLYKLNKLNLLFDKRIKICKLRMFIIHKAKKISISNIDSFAPVSINISDKYLERALKNVYKMRCKSLLIYKGKQHLKQIFTNSYLNKKVYKNWFTKVSVFNIILRNKNVQSILLNDNNPKAIYNFTRYINKKDNNDDIVDDPESFSLHLIELPYIDKFNKLLLRHISQSKSQVMKINIHKLIRDLRRVKSYLLSKKKDSLNKS